MKTLLIGLTLLLSLTAFAGDRNTDLQCISYSSERMLMVMGSIEQNRKKVRLKISSLGSGEQEEHVFNITKEIETKKKVKLFDKRGLIAVIKEETCTLFVDGDTEIMPYETTFVLGEESYTTCCSNAGFVD